MITHVISSYNDEEIANAAGEAVRVLELGGCVALPTETVYGLGCDALNATAAAGVFAAKERPSFDPLIAHVSGVEWISRLTASNGSIRKLAEKLAERFWPGPFTMVLPARVDGDGIVPDLVRSGLPTVALRCSAHPVMRAVVERLGRPVAAPSANRFGRISPVTAGHVMEELDGRIPLVLDGGVCRHGLESTIVAVREGDLVILRPGPVGREELEEFGCVRKAEEAALPDAPGMLKSHYAPRTPLQILAEDEEIPEDAATSGVMVFGRGGEEFAVIENLSEDLLLASPEFYSALRRLDASGVGRIYVRAVREEGLGVAIMDRLRKAAHE